MSLFRKLMIAIVLAPIFGVAFAADKHVTAHPTVKQQMSAQAADRRKSSRQRIIDAAQVYCKGGTPFDRVHGYLQDFWAEKDPVSAPPNVRCKVH